MKYAVVTVWTSVADQDADLLDKLDRIIIDRFEGTAVTVHAVGISISDKADVE